MRIVHFEKGGCRHGLTERESRSPAIQPELIAQGADLLRTRRDLPPMHAIDLDAVRILPPVLKPSKMLCVGLNHDDHLEHRMHLRYRGGVALLGHISATETNPSSHAEINGCHSLVKGHFRSVPGIQYHLRVALIVRETLTPKGPVVWRRC
jgi:hypothetical protein